MHRNAAAARFHIGNQPAASGDAGRYQDSRFGSDGSQSAMYVLTDLNL
jgi:hypothetical protein